MHLHRVLCAELNKLNRELYTVSGKPPFDNNLQPIGCDETAKMNHAIAQKNLSVFLKLTDSLNAQLEAHYLKIEKQPHYSNCIKLRLISDRINTVGDVWFAAREMRLSTVLPFLLKEVNLFKRGARDRDIYYLEGLLVGLEAQMMEVVQQPLDEEREPEHVMTAAAAAAEPVVSVVVEEKVMDGLDDEIEAPRPAAPRQTTAVMGPALDLYRGESDSSAPPTRTPSARSSRRSLGELSEVAASVTGSEDEHTLNEKQETPDLSVKLLVFGNKGALIRSLSFWSWLQGKSGKISRAQYGLNLLKAVLLLQGQDNIQEQVRLLSNVTVVLFSQRLRLRRVEATSN